MQLISDEIPEAGADKSQKHNFKLTGKSLRKLEGEWRSRKAEAKKEVRFLLPAAPESHFQATYLFASVLTIRTTL